MQKDAPFSMLKELLRWGGGKRGGAAATVTESQSFINQEAP